MVDLSSLLRCRRPLPLNAGTRRASTTATLPCKNNYERSTTCTEPHQHNRTLLSRAYNRNPHPRTKQSPRAKTSLLTYLRIRVTYVESSITTFAPQCQRCTPSKQAQSQSRRLQARRKVQSSHPTFSPAGFTMMVRSSPPIDSGFHRRTRRVWTTALLAPIHHCVSRYNILTFCFCR